MAIQSVDELLRALREHPEWASSLREVVLTEELLRVPALMAQLTERVDQMADGMGQLVQGMGQLVQGMSQLTERMDQLTERMDQLVQRMDQLTERMDQLTERMDQLTERMDQLVQRMDQLTARMDQLVQRMDQLTERMDQLTERMDQLTERMDQLTERVDALAVQVQALVERQDRLDVRLEGLVEQLSAVAVRTDRAIGYMVEQQYRAKAHAYFQTIARRLHVLTPDELDDVLEPALERGDISDEDAAQVRWADAVIRGRRDDVPVYLVLEASAVVDVDDIQRAEFRARVMATAAGAPALAVAAGEKILGEAFTVARRQAVWLVTDGHVEAPSAA